MDIGVRIEIDMADLARVNALVTRLTEFDAGELVAEIVDLGENQTRKRIESGGPGPDGEAWPPNLTGTPILMRTGDHLRYYVASSSSGSSGEWGDSWEFAHVHQDGATITPKNAERLAFMLGPKRVFAKSVTIPARPFVGVSADDAREIEELVTDFMRAML
ncbi:phage virion morphogenesis protein [Methylocystis sp. WRRC1]|uniref:phage virion morphogenesis protein n=1 Tax=unclassified Methylocystis TaxID=2625913 RepID=UPI0001F86A91|nr:MULTISPECIES: phage virion morphogenesis protein [unclassified Methylocystis]MCC3246142.1 phage virion morphogenesis protein [Methylocystis sp. WRRC1]